MRSRASAAMRVASGCVSAIAATLARTPEGRSGFPEAGFAERREEVFAARLLVVPGERDLAHEVRVGGRQARVAGESGGKTRNASFAADAGHLHRLGLRRPATQPSVLA